MKRPRLRHLNLSRFIFAKLLGLIIVIGHPQTPNASSSTFPNYLSEDFDYAEFMRFEASNAPMNSIYQSNGFLAIRERGFAEQSVLIPATTDSPPHNTSDRLFVLEIDAPVFFDALGTKYLMSDSSAHRRISYYPDRTVYRAAFPDGPTISITVYPIYDQPAAVLRIEIEKTKGLLTTALPVRGTRFQAFSGPDKGVLVYGSQHWPYRLLLGASPKADMRADGMRWRVKQGDRVSTIVALGGTHKAALKTLRQVSASPDLMDRSTRRDWNRYLASCPLVAPAQEMQFRIGTTGEQKTISPEELVRSELWFWRGLLNTTCRVDYLPACPMPIADWNSFMGMWGNDGIAEAMAFAATSRKDLARAAIINWFRYAVNANGDGSCAWTIFPSGRNTYQATGAERQTESVPQQGLLVGTYVRLTGDAGILDEKIGGRNGIRTLWQALVAYQRNLREVRDFNRDHLIDWLHTYETGWDDKDSPFVDQNMTPTSAINEQVYNLWSLQEMMYLSRLLGEDVTEWEREFELAKTAIRTKLWDAATERYWDMNAQDGTLWTSGENLDAYYFLYYEPDKTRITAMIKRLKDPKKFNGVLWPTLAFDDDKWGGYWRGPAWPRIFSYVSVALSRAGERQLAFEWLARAINSNLGPILPEHIDPKGYPPAEHIKGGVRIMGYDALDCLVFPDVAGLRMWAGDDLVVASDPAIGKVFVRGQKWKGDSYNVLFEPGKATRIWRNGRKLKPLPATVSWRAEKTGRRVNWIPLHARGDLDNSKQAQDDPYY